MSFFRVLLRACTCLALLDVPPRGSTALVVRSATAFLLTLPDSRVTSRCKHQLACVICLVENRRGRSKGKTSGSSSKGQASGSSNKTANVKCEGLLLLVRPLEPAVEGRCRPRAGTTSSAVVEKAVRM